MTPNRRTVLVSALAVSVLLALWARHAAQSPLEDTGAISRGMWRIAAADALPDSDRSPGESERLARQLSLPYASGLVRAPQGFGVRAWDRERAAPGLNLYLSAHAAEAILLAMDGTTLHRWRCPFERAFPGLEGAVDSYFFRRAALLANGDLVAIYQGGGIVRLDARSEIVWARPGTPFNDLWVSPAEDRILFPEKLARDRPDLRASGPILEDWIVTLDGDGHEIGRVSLLAAFESSPYRSLLEPLGETADILHTNTIAVLADPVPADLPFAAGDWLISLREVDVVAVLAAGGHEVRWAQRGPWHRQHEPSLLADGTILLFDNRGAGEGRSRVVTVDPRSGRLETLWPPEGISLDSQQMGSVARLANGDLLVVESEHGYAREISPQGEVVWEFLSPHRAGARSELVAVLADLVRLTPTTPFLEPFAGAASGSGDQAP
ncbi:MAG: arylsulfotransferase family protein [Thermoanaerobaculia bacterium]